jgi:CRISPR/Cas system CMR subunit Cmr4 (Cas7 group RAMP superfamily)
MSNPYTPERYLLMTLDPLHVGAGGNRLGRVDLSIVREPGTKLPKIPGTSLHGAIRQYAAYRYENASAPAVVRASMSTVETKAARSATHSAISKARRAGKAGTSALATPGYFSSLSTLWPGRSG